MKGLAPLSDRCWVPFQPDEDVPAFGVMEGTGTVEVGGQTVLTTGKYDTTGQSPDKSVWVNGPVGVSSGEVGYCQSGMGYPVAVLGSGTGTVGPSNDSWEVSTGHPGFIAIGSGAVSGTVWAIRAPQITWVRGLLTAALNTTDATFTIDNVTTMTGLEVVSSSADTITVQNLMDWEGDDNGNAYAVFSHADKLWYPPNVECPA